MSITKILSTRVGLVLFFVITIVNGLQAQKQANYWLFDGYELNFSSDPVKITQNAASHLNRGMGSICDANGKVLLYTDGFSVFDRNNGQMPNGYDLIPNAQTTSTQESIIIPKPGNANIYYIFTVDPWNGQSTSGLYYAEVNMSLNGGKGDVTSKGMRLVENTTNKLSASFHANGTDVWVITHQHNTNNYFVVKITANGVSAEVSKQSLGTAHSFWYGQLKVSPDGKKMAVSYSDPTGGMSLFDFDKSTGILSNAMDFSFLDIDNAAMLDGLDFSSDATKLYVCESRYNSIFQFDVTKLSFNEINSSRSRVPGYVNNNSLRQFQLAPDGNIYVTKGGGGGGTEHLGVISNLNGRAADVVVEENGLYLNGGNTFVNYTPNFIQNYLFKTSFSHTGHCQGEPIQYAVTNEYRLDSVRWYLGEGTTSVSRHPTIRYKTGGTYNVKLLAYYSGIADTITQDVVIDPLGIFSLGHDTTICKGSRIEMNADFASYRWSNGDTLNYTHISESGAYWLKTTTAWGCSFIDTLLVSVNDLPLISLADSIYTENTTFEVNPGTFVSYVWSTGETTSTIKVNKQQWYSVEVKNAAGCKAAKSFYAYYYSESPDQSQTDWEVLNPKPSVNGGTDIYFVDDQNGFIVNGGELLRTRDKGETWTVQMKMLDVKRLAFKNSIGYAVGDYGAIYKSTQYGDGWNLMSFNSSEDLNSVTVIHPDTVFVTSSTKIFSTFNSGQTWTTYQLEDNYATITDAFFTSSRVGHVVTEGGNIFKTTDGGKTWRTTLSVDYFPSGFFRIKFINSQVGYASREFSDMLITTDGGESWQQTSYGTDAAYTFQFVNERIGYAAGEYGTIYKTYNGGYSWDPIGFDARIYARDLHGIFFINENEGFVSGLNGRIMKTMDGGQHWKEYANYRYIKQVQFTSHDVGYYVSESDIFRTNNKGKTWMKCGPPASDDSNVCLSFIDDNNGFASVSGRVYKTTDGGVSWGDVSKTYIAGAELSDFQFVDSNTGFAALGYWGSGIVKTTDGGTNWSSFATDLTFGKIQFLNSMIGYARSTRNDTNKMYKTTDGGINWTVVYQIDNDITSFHFVDEATGFFVGDDGMMYTTTNGAATWKKLDAVPYGDFVDVKFFTPRYGYIVDDYGVVYYTSDGGVTWSYSLRNYSIKSLEMFTTDVYAFGDYGAILKKSIGYKEEVMLKPLSLLNLTESAASVTADVQSYIKIVGGSVVAEIRKQGDSNSKFEAVETLNGTVNESISYTFQNLEPETVYSCRYHLYDHANELVTTELIFRTLKKPATTVVTGRDTPEKHGYDVYPNPSKGIILINADGQLTYKYEVCDVTGSKLALGNSAGNTSLDLSAFEPGIYILQIEDSKQKVAIRIVRE